MILNRLRDSKTGKPVEIPDALSTEEIKIIEDKANDAANRLKQMAKEAGINKDNIMFVHVK